MARVISMSDAINEAMKLACRAQKSHQRSKSRTSER